MIEDKKDRQSRASLSNEQNPPNRPPKGEGKKRSRHSAIVEDAQNILSAVFDPKYRKYLVGSVLFHCFVAAAFAVNWESEKEIKKVQQPKAMSVRAATPEELKALRDIKQRKVDREQAAKKEAERKKKEAKRKEQAKKKKLAEQKRKKEVERKRKLEAKKAAEKKKKELIKKKNLEKKKKEAEKLKKKQEADKQRLLEKKQLEDKKRKEALEKKVQEAKLAAEKKRQEDKLAQRMEKLAQEREAKRLLEIQRNAQIEKELSEVEYYKALIHDRIYKRWSVPPRSKGLAVTLNIKLFPSGELSGVNLKKSSGVDSFDNSALHAVKGITTYPVPKDSQIFENNFRSFLFVMSSDRGL